MLHALSVTDPSCRDAYQVSSTCYKVFKDESVSWTTAKNRCRSYNASLAVFTDNFLEYFPPNVLSERAWIGLWKPVWYWPSAGQHEMFMLKYRHTGYSIFSDRISKSGDAISSVRSFVCSLSVEPTDL